MTNPLTDQINSLLETALTSLYHLRNLEEHWDVLDEDVQLLVLCELDRIESRTTRIGEFAVQLASMGNDISEEALQLLRKL